MYEIIFYKTKHGEIPVKDYISELCKETSKDSRIKLAKVEICMKLLKEYGFGLKRPYAAPLKNKIWELRPQNNRIMFAAAFQNSFILLHVFKKDTDKVPDSEIEKAEKELADFYARGNEGYER